MTAKTIGKKDWKRLYDLADQIWEIAPWNFMYEDDLFCVKLPDDETVYFYQRHGIE